MSVRSPGGYDSIAPKRDLALRAAQEWEETGRQTHVLHCGDFDPDGLEVYKVFKEDALAFLDAHLPGGDDPEDVLVIERILALPEHVRDLPPERRPYFDHGKVKSKNHRGQR